MITTTDKVKTFAKVADELVFQHARSEVTLTKMTN